jgi:hypothetical protein
MAGTGTAIETPEQLRSRTDETTTGQIGLAEIATFLPLTGR